MSKIASITATKILDSHSNWTVRTKIALSDGSVGVGEVPSGISTGKYEAILLPVDQALANVNGKIAPDLKGLEAKDQEKIDQTLIELDGTKDKSSLGANAILSVSLATCDAAAQSQNQPLYQYIRSKCQMPAPNRMVLGENAKWKMPTPMLLMLEGGKHASNQLDFQEFMITPKVGDTFREKLEAGVAIYNLLSQLLDQKSYSTAVGAEGGFSPQNMKIPEALQFINEAIEQSGKNIKIGLDIAASSFVRGNTYKLEGLGQPFTPEALLTFYKDLISAHPRLSLLEDPFAEEHEESWKAAGERLGDEIEIIGDDILVTNKERLKNALEKDLITGVIVKPNQIGTLTETIEFAKLAKKSDLKIIVSHRGGETNSSFISDLAVAIGADYIKTGAPARGERVAKYNRLLEIERELKTDSGESNS